MKKLYSAIIASLVSYQACAIDLPELNAVEQEVELDASVVIDPQFILGTSSVNEDWQAYTEINKSPVLNNTQSQRKSSALMSTKAAQTTCYNATENYAVYNSITNVGDRSCFILDLTSKTKLEGYAANQPAGVNYDLGLYRFENNQFTLLDSSANAVGNDHTVAVVEPGRYVFIVTKTSGANNDNYIFATYSSPQFDAYEANDKVSLASQIRDNNLLTGNLDSPRDRDYYFYKVGVNQKKVNVSLQGSDLHQLEIYTGAWTAVNAKDNPISIDVSYGMQVAMRIVPKPGVTFNPNSNYTLRASYPADDIENTSTWSPDNVTNLVSPSYVEAYDTLSFSGTLVDIYDRPIPNEKVVAVVVANGTQLTKETYSDKNGRYGFYFDNMPTCSEFGAERTTEWSNFGSPATQWEIYYKPQAFGIYPSGSSTKAERTYIQICKERVIGNR